MKYWIAYVKLEFFLKIDLNKVYHQVCKVVTLQWSFGSNLHDLEKLCENLYKKLYALF